MLRGVVFLALVGGAGFSAWTSFQDSSRNPLDWAIGEVHAMVTQREDEAVVQNEPQLTEAKPLALSSETTIPADRFTISRETLAAITCGPWDVSDAGMEAILQEMIRRGWTPPSGATALQASGHDEDVKAVDPDATVPAPLPEIVSADAESSLTKPSQTGASRF
ncbi:MAG TPA: hypothetical protein VFV70_07585 [Hyphomonadaceae bacterium]|nr:hypothetical protein [Hyphomonadaceae bacterium]